MWCIYTSRHLNCTWYLSTNYMHITSSSFKKLYCTAIQARHFHFKIHVFQLIILIRFQHFGECILAVLEDRNVWKTFWDTYPDLKNYGLNPMDYAHGQKSFHSKYHFLTVPIPLQLEMFAPYYFLSWTKYCRAEFSKYLVWNVKYSTLISFQCHYLLLSCSGQVTMISTWL